MTKAERTLWSRLRNRQLGGYKIRRQHVLCGYIVDFFCQEVDLVIEVDGEVHLSEDAMQADARRENILQAHGYNIIRFTHPNVRLHTSDVCQRLLQHIPTIERNTQND
jgi:very-short-patch-repair endonuclease